MTVVSTITRLIEDVGDRRDSNTSPAAGREFSLAVTALEEAQMRYTRARTIQEKGALTPYDWDGEEVTT